MNRFAVGVLLGVVGGIGASWFYAPTSGPTPETGMPVIVRDLGEVAPMTAAEEATHRAQRFEAMTTVEETLRLRSDFDQTEAMYVIAGRSDSAQVQNLIFQALRIADASDRRAGLSILFSRLTDIDPHSAVAMAGQAPFTAERSVEPAIWRTWSRSDLDAALLAASALTPASRRRRAAEAIYSAHGNLGNDRTRHIEEILGIPPSRRIKSQHVLSLAADSPEAAFDYLNQLSTGSDQNDAAWVLGGHFGRNVPSFAEAYASRISNGTARATYTRHAVESAAKADPELMLDRWLGAPDAQRHLVELSQAIAVLASTDIESAISYVQAADDQQVAVLLSTEIIKRLAQDDPERALQWAHENGRGQARSVFQQAIIQVAAAHPEIALSAINEFPAGTERDSLTGMVISAWVRSDPESAVVTLEGMPAGSGKQQAVQFLLMGWAEVDTRAAMSWAIENSESYGLPLSDQISRQLISQDPQVAIQLLPRMDEKTAADWSVRIVQTLAGQQSIAEAEEFANRYRNSPQYPYMQEALIPLLARTDLARAKQMADGMPQGPNQDSVYLQLIGTAAAEDPRQAAVWIEAMQGESRRSQAISVLVQTWSRSDASGASRWVNGLPAGDSRDDALVALVSSATNFDESSLRLIESIGSDEKKYQATTSYLYRLSRVDPSRAEHLLNTLSLSRSQRTQIEQMLNQIAGRVTID
jgi:hypothetical protein